MVQEFDSISTEGITYYSLTPTTISKEVAAAHLDDDCYIVKHTSAYIVEETPAEKEGYIAVQPDQNITLSTENGVFTYTNATLQVKARTATSVTFSLPFGCSEVTVNTQEAGEKVSTTYRLAD